MAFKELSHLPTSRKAAKDCGSKQYFTGSLCSNGHKSSKYTSNGRCITCSNILRRKYRSENFLKEAEKYKEWRLKNLDKNYKPLRLFLLIRFLRRCAVL